MRLIGAVVAGHGNIIVEDCKNNGNIAGSAGIIGRVNSYISDIGNAEKILGYAIVRNCTNRGNVICNESPDGDAAGCIRDVVFCTNIEIDSCINEGIVEGETVGGIVGGIIASQSSNSMNAELLIMNCINKGDVRANESSAGGIVGNADFYMEEQKITQCIKLKNNVNQGSVTGAGYGIGGILGAVLGMHGGVNDEITLVENKNEGGYICNIAFCYSRWRCRMLFLR